MKHAIEISLIIFNAALWLHNIKLAYMIAALM